MKKIILCFLILNAILLGDSQVYAKSEIYSSETLKIHRISEHVYVHISYLHTEEWGKVSCNGMIVTHGNEAVVFDTPTDDPASLELINWISDSLDSKIIAVIPTHYHEDNLGGLNEFHRQGIISYAYQKTIEITGANDYPRPQHGFDRLLELEMGGEKIMVEFCGEGHTCDNVIGYFPLDDILFGGCLIKEIGAGKGNLVEANPVAWPESVKNVKSKYPDAKIVVPGHGAWGGLELLNYTINLFE